MIKAQGHRILVKPDAIETTTKSGIVLAIDEKMEKGGVQRGLVVSVGSQAWKAFGPDFSGEPWAKVGDYVLFSRFAGKFVQDPEDPEVEYMIMNDEDILGVIEEGVHSIPLNPLATKQVEIS